MMGDFWHYREVLPLTLGLEVLLHGQKVLSLNSFNTFWFMEFRSGKCVKGKLVLTTFIMNIVLGFLES